MKLQSRKYTSHLDKHTAKYVYIVSVIQLYMTRLLSVRIEEHLLEESKRLKINYSEVVRAALKEEIKKRRDKELEGSISRIRHLLKGVDMEQLVLEIRKDREER